MVHVGLLWSLQRKALPANHNKHCRMDATWPFPDEAALVKEVIAMPHNWLHSLNSLKVLLFLSTITCSNRSLKHTIAQMVGDHCGPIKSGWKPHFSDSCKILSQVGSETLSSSVSCLSRQSNFTKTVSKCKESGREGQNIDEKSETLWGGRKSLFANQWELGAAWSVTIL